MLTIWAADYFLMYNYIKHLYDFGYLAKELLVSIFSATEKCLDFPYFQYFHKPTLFKKQCLHEANKNSLI